MPRVFRSSIIIAFLSAAAGVAITLLLATLFVSEDPQLVIAKQRFSELPPATARQIKSRFNSLQALPKKHEYILAIHEAVTADPDLDVRLTQLHAWWLTLDDAQRAELRETPKELWLEEVQKQLSESSASDQIVLSLRGLPGPGGRGRMSEIRVSADQMDRFLTAAFPEQLSEDESQLIESADLLDRPLASGIVILKRIFEARSGSRGTNSAEIDQVFEAAKSHLLPERFREYVRAEGARSGFFTFVILRSVMDHLSAEFFDRQAISNDKVEVHFAALERSRRMEHMMSDPVEAAGALQTQLKSADRDSPSGRLAAELDNLKSGFQERFRQEFRPPRSGRGPDNGRPERGRRGGRGPDDEQRRRANDRFRPPPGDR